MTQRPVAGIDTRFAGRARELPSHGLPSTTLGQLRVALASSASSDSAGSTHSFYHYPARFSPAIARAVIEVFSEPGDCVLDPFMGGGTSIVEGLALGRYMIGVDINSLATFVTRVRTTPLSRADERSIRRWAQKCSDQSFRDFTYTIDARMENLPKGARQYLAFALQASTRLDTSKRRAFARCALLRLGQRALDCRDVAPRKESLAGGLVPLVEEMLAGLQQFTEECSRAGINKASIGQRRRVFCRSAVGLQNDSRLGAMSAPRLIFTSPPYPSVHVLYHRWQYRGRKESGAPYWIADLRDGRPGSFYTGGSRTPKGLRDYFEMITRAFASVRAMMDTAGLVVQLVGFSDTTEQLPRYLVAMQEAGFEEYRSAPSGRLRRRVPNRKWYAKLQGDVDPSSEMLLIHRPAT